MGLQIVAAGNQPRHPLTTMIYGASRLGKTWMAATWPSPLFLSAGLEHGDTTLTASFPHVPVARITSRRDMQEALAYIRAYDGKGVFETVVVDSATFYADIVVAELVKEAKNQQMGPKDWGKLDVEMLKMLMPTLHNLKAHVVWTALVQEIKDEDGKILRILPMLYGKGADKLPATCDLILYMDLMQMLDPATKMYNPVPVARTSPHNNAIAGGRFGPVFREGWIRNHFFEIASRIGPYIGVVPAQPQAPGAAAVQQQAIQPQ